MAATILLVDDDEVLGQILGRVLTRAGYHIIPATTVAQALLAAQQEPPQLALLDLCLPDGDGVQLARELQTQVPALRVVVMTAYPLRLRDLPEGGPALAGLLTKPLNLQELRSVLRAILEPAGNTGRVGSSVRSAV
jgi:DNA-binding response OmpR family regulator